MSSEFAIKVENLSKCYQIYSHPRDRLKQFIFPRFQRVLSQQPKRYFQEFWALRDVSFEVNKGETIGIIGRNGSGKSTLLQLICGTLNPTAGRVITNGRIAALLELGSGFNPEFTGRENVYMNAAVLGLSHDEITARYNKIATFADIGDFIEQPVKTLSSGMMVRLAFAVIAHVDAEVLVVDEALSVGDVFFSQKCMRFFESFKDSGGTVLFVSHDSAAVLRLCDHAILLSNGKLIQKDASDLVCKTYLEQLYAEREPFVKKQIQQVDDKAGGNHELGSQCMKFTVSDQLPNEIYVSDFNKSSADMGIRGATILDAGYFDRDGRRLSKLISGSRAVFKIELICNMGMEYPAVGLVLKDRLGQSVFTESTTWAFEKHYGRNQLEFKQGDIVKVSFDHIVPILFEGEYAITVAIAEGFGHDHIQHHLIHEALILRSTGRRILHGMSGFNGLKTVICINRKNLASEMPQCSERDQHE